MPCSRYFFCFCCCCVKKRSGLEFYEEETAKYSEEFEKEKEKALKSPLGIAFVTFRTLAMSKEVYDAFRKSIFQVCTQSIPACCNSAFKASFVFY